MGADMEVPVRRVLVVDDNRDAANSVALLLKLCRQQVVQAYDGATAVTLAREFHPDLVLLDLVMPQMDGFAVARELRDLPELENTKIVALTAFGQPAFREATTVAGFDGHVLKPASAQEMLKILATT